MGKEYMMFFEGKDNGSMEKIQDAIAETLTLYLSAEF